METILETLIERVPGFAQAGRGLAVSLHRAILAGGKPVRRVADLLHGTWLGHPLHPMLTDATLGAWMYASLLDLVGFFTRSKSAQDAADALTALGVVSAVPTALAGMTDYSGIKRGAAPAGLLHALLNTEALIYYAMSLPARRQGRREWATVLSQLGLGTLLLSGYLGGLLVYKYRVGVNHAPKPTGPRDWTPVLPENELAEHQSRRVEVEGEAVLLYRYGGTVYAIGAICSHAGGPLEEGTFDGTCVQCPWHDSVFDVRDGSLVHGPSTFPQPRYAARMVDGQIEVRLAGD